MMNTDWLIFDTQEKNTINGLPIGALAPSSLIGVPSEPKIDIAGIVGYFHAKEGKVLCPYTGEDADGLRAVDGNPMNFLITNLEPISTKFMTSIQGTPDVSYTLPFTIVDYPYNYSVRMKLEGQLQLIERNVKALKNYVFAFPNNITRMEKIWYLWNLLTKELLIKGLVELTITSAADDVEITLNDRSVLSYTIQALKNPNCGINSRGE